MADKSSLAHKPTGATAPHGFHGKFIEGTGIGNHLPLLPVLEGIMRFPFIFLLLFPLGLRAEAPALLQEVAEKLVDERQNWGFTQLVRETNREGEAVERLERFNPSRGHANRWELVTINGRPPTERELQDWSKRKNRPKRNKTPKALEDYVDLSQAKVREETVETVSYDVPLRSSAGGLFPGNKINVTLTINKQTRDIERAQAGIDEPFNVALGLGRVIDLDLDIEVPAEETPVAAGDKPEQPQGTASAVVNKLGRRVEYHWSEFKKVTSPPETARPPQP